MFINKYIVFQACILLSQRAFLVMLEIPLFGLPDLGLGAGLFSKLTKEKFLVNWYAGVYLVQF